MTERKIYLRMIRKIEEWENRHWSLWGGVPMPPVPYVPLMLPREDWQEKPYWLRTRSNPHRNNYH